MGLLAYMTAAKKQVIKHEYKLKINISISSGVVTGCL